MGVFNITECDKVMSEEMPIANLLTTGENITTSGVSAKNASEFDSACKFLRVVTDTDIYVKMGTSSVTASAGDMFIPAGVIEYLHVKTGDTHIAAIDK